MATCKSCGMNLCGYCPVFERQIPKGKEAQPHDCQSWRPKRVDDAITIVDKLMATHEEHKATWWIVRDMISADIKIPTGLYAAGWRMIWKAPYIDDDTRVLIANAVVPF